MINSRRQLIILASAILTVAVTIVPSLWFMMTDARNRAAELGAISESSARDRTRLMRAFYHSLDKEAANIATVLATSYESNTQGSDYWYRLYSRILLGVTYIHDIMLVEPDGIVLAHGRLDTPISIERLMSTGPTLVRGKVLRLPSFVDYPYESGVLPYIIGVDPDEEGTCRHAIVLLVDSTVFKRMAPDLHIDPSIDLCILDNAGRVLFRYPDSLAAMMPGEKIPGPLWGVMLSAAGQNTTEMRDEDGTVRVLCVSSLEDDEGALVGVVTSSFVKDFLVQKVLGANPIDPGFSPLPVVLAAAAGGIVVGVLLMRRLILDSDSTPHHEHKKKKITKGDIIDKALLERDILTATYGRQRGIALIDEMVAREDVVASGITVFYSEISGSNVNDALLSEAAAVLKRVFPTDAITLRYSDTAFVTATRGSDKAHAEYLYDRVTKMICALSPENDPCNVTIGVDIATFTTSGPLTANQLIEAAKSDMQRANESA